MMSKGIGKTLLYFDVSLETQHILSWHDTPSAHPAITR